eukprot:112766-Prymnesium_polylepis.1
MASLGVLVCALACSTSASTESSTSRAGQRSGAVLAAPSTRLLSVDANNPMADPQFGKFLYDIGAALPYVAEYTVDWYNRLDWAAKGQFWYNVHRYFDCTCPDHRMLLNASAWWEQWLLVGTNVEVAIVSFWNWVQKHGGFGSWFTWLSQKSLSPLFILDVLEGILRFQELLARNVTRLPEDLQFLVKDGTIVIGGTRVSG